MANGLIFRIAGGAHPCHQPTLILASRQREIDKETLADQEIETKEAAN